MAQFPANYPEELKKYGYPPPFPAGCRPEDYGYSPISSPEHHPTRTKGDGNQKGAPISHYQQNWEQINIAGNLFSSCDNTNQGNGIQENGDVKFSNHYEETYGTNLNAYGRWGPNKQINIAGHVRNGCNNVNLGSGSQKNGDLEIGNYTKKISKN